MAREQRINYKNKLLNILYYHYILLYNYYFINKNLIKNLIKINKITNIYIQINN